MGNAQTTLPLASAILAYTCMHMRDTWLKLVE